jgi:hypothetical protein
MYIYKKNIMKIKIIKDIIFNEDTVDEVSLKKDVVIESDEPYEGMNEDGTFTICRGMGWYFTISSDCFIVLK